MILGIMMVTAVGMSAAAYAILFVAVSQAKQATALKDRTQSRYAAEAGIVWAMQRLMLDPTLRFTLGAGPDPPNLNGYSLDVYDNCPVAPAPCDNRSLSAKAVKN